MGDPFVSDLMNCISLHLWLIQGLYCFVVRLQGSNNPKDVVWGVSVHQWGFIADTLFVIIVFSDTVLSYFYVFYLNDSVTMAWIDLVNQMGWVISGAIYLMTSVHDHNQYH